MSIQKGYIKWLFALCLMLITSLSAAEMHVYLTSTVPVKDRDRALKSDTGLSGINITVLGKFREFSSSVKRNKPSYIIAPSSFSNINKDYKAVYQFSLNGQSSFKYLILATKPKWTKANISKGSIGIVDELGRTGTKKFVLANVGKFKLVKRVTKADDLMPLLVLENANYIMIRPNNYEILKQKFTAQTIKILESKTVEHPMIYVLNNTPQAEIDKLGKMSQDTIKALGFSELKKTGDGK
jgi:hypothetical protein